jgi:lathosterol oxidase
MALPTAFLFVFELQGYSKLYDNVADHAWGWGMILLSLPLFLFFTDMGIYWIHRWLHHPLLYGPIHKPHHKWVICTPFASHAFHPVDGFSQSVPYHLYAFIFPLHKVLYVVLFVLVNIWTVSIHDEIYKVPEFLRPFVNGSAHHTDHHTDFNYNFGQYFTLWDRIGGSFKEPSGFIPGKSVYDQLDRQLRGVEEEDALHGVDPADRAAYAKKHDIKSKDL